MENENQNVDQILQETFQNDEYNSPIPEPERAYVTISDEDEEISDETPEDRAAEELRLQRKKISKLQTDKYRLKSEVEQVAAEAMRVREENNALRGYMENSTHATMFHYENGINLEVEQAKEALKRALEINDIDSQIDANVKLTQLGAQKENIRAWKVNEESKAQQAQQWNQQQQYQQQHKNPYIPQNQVELPEEADNWFSQNTWFVEDSPDYDEEKATDVLTYIQAYDANLERQGRTNEYLTPQYFNKINNYIQNTYGDEPPQKNQFQVKKTNHLVSPVKRSENLMKSPPKKIVLSPRERELVRSLGGKEEDYARFKKKREDEERERQQNRR